MERSFSFDDFINHLTLPGFPGNKKEKLKKNKEEKEIKKIIMKDKIFLRRKIPPSF
jgi:hypothetical protein